MVVSLLVVAQKEVIDYMICMLLFLGTILKVIVQTGLVYPLSVLASCLASFINSGEISRLLLVSIIVYVSLGRRFTTSR